MDVKPAIRTTIDGTFILRETNHAMRKKLYDNYGTNIPSLELFCQLLDNITNDYMALYIDNTKQSNNWQDTVYWYKPAIFYHPGDDKPHPVPADFRFGCDDYWAFHYERYNPEYIDPITI